MKKTEQSAARPVKIHIDELVLHGFAAGDRYRIAAALEHELSRLITAQGLAAAGRKSFDIERMRGGTIKVTAGAKPQVAGVEIARAVFRSLRQQALISTIPSRTGPGKGGRS